MTPVITELHHQIRADPDDDTLRLVLADHYQDQGQPDRAELIRLQLERANLPTWHPDAVHLDLAERALLAEHNDAWRQSLPNNDPITWGRFERGLIARVGFNDFSDFLAHGSRCFEATPVAGLMLRWPQDHQRPKVEVMDHPTYQGRLNQL